MFSYPKNLQIPNNVDVSFLYFFLELEVICDGFVLRRVSNTFVCNTSSSPEEFLTSYCIFLLLSGLQMLYDGFTLKRVSKHKHDWISSIDSMNFVSTISVSGSYLKVSPTNQICVMSNLRQYIIYTYSHLENQQVYVHSKQLENER